MIWCLLIFLIGSEVDLGDDCAVAESVKAADIYAPLSGEIIAVNEELDGSPELVTLVILMGMDGYFA